MGKTKRMTCGRRSPERLATRFIGEPPEQFVRAGPRASSGLESRTAMPALRTVEHNPTTTLTPMDPVQKFRRVRDMDARPAAWAKTDGAALEFPSPHPGTAAPLSHGTLSFQSRSPKDMYLHAMQDVLDCIEPGAPRIVNDGRSGRTWRAARTGTRHPRLAC